jgi:hypothetical protein
VEDVNWHPSSEGKSGEEDVKITMAVPALDLSRVKWKVSISFTGQLVGTAINHPPRKTSMLEQTPCTRQPAGEFLVKGMRTLKGDHAAAATMQLQIIQRSALTLAVSACMPLQDHNDVQSFSARPQLRLQDFGYINVERNGGAVTTRCKKKGGGWATPENVPPELQAEFLRLRLVKTPVLPVIIPFMINQTHRVSYLDLHHFPPA